jgi:branched-chain amino acid transport system permease protein
MVSKIAFIALYGISFGMILFTISVGLAVTMGVMRVINLAHGAFAAAGAYFAVGLMSRAALPLSLAIVVATMLVVVISIPIERLFYRPIYDRPELDHVLLTIGLVFLAIASLTALFGPDPIPALLPPWLAKNVEIAGIQIQIYRVAVVAVGLAIIAALWVLLNKTAFGVELRAAVDNRSMAEAIGINVSRVFSMSFALSAGLAALGGAVGYGLIPAEPTYPFKYLVIILFVVGLTSGGKILDCAGVALAIGIVDTAARFLMPAVGSYVVYVLAVALMFYRSRGVFHAT